MLVKIQQMEMAQNVQKLRSKFKKGDFLLGLGYGMKKLFLKSEMIHKPTNFVHTCKIHTTSV